MKRNFLIILLITIVQTLFAQTFEEELYFTTNINYDTLRTIRCITCNFDNKSDTTKVIMFTEDDLDSMDIDKAIFRKCYRRYNDVQLAIWSNDNAINESESFIFPELFVKILHPKQTFKLMILSENTSSHVIIDFMRKHLILREESCINRHVNNFAESLEENNVDCPYASLVVEWKVLESFTKRGRQKISISN